MNRHPMGGRARPPSRRFAADAGQVGGMEVLPFGFLVFVSGTLLLANVWAVIDAKFASATAAREAVRAFVEADAAPEAHAAAIRRARETLAAYGRDSSATIGEPHLPDGFRRCARVTIVVGVDVPALTIPWIGGFGTLDIVESSATELIDPYRDGLDGAARC